MQTIYRHKRLTTYFYNSEFLANKLEKTNLTNYWEVYGVYEPRVLEFLENMKEQEEEIRERKSTEVDGRGVPLHRSVPPNQKRKNVPHPSQHVPQWGDVAIDEDCCGAMHPHEGHGITTITSPLSGRSLF